MHYSVKTGACLLAMFVAFQSSAFAQSHTEPGSGATYHYDDWRKQPPQEAFDVAPAPAEGMHSFISRLDYPAELRRRRVTGTMRVSVTLDAAGQVQDVKVIQSVHPSLDRIVTSAIRKTRWTPALKHGVPIAAKISFRLTFKAARWAEVSSRTSEVVQQGFAGEILSIGVLGI